METYKHTRKASTAILLSLIMPGLGQIYCGAFAFGLIIALIGIILIPAVGISIASENTLLIALSCISAAIFTLTVIIEATIRAKRTDAAYELKEYNRWYIYLLLIFISMGGSLPTALVVKAHLVEAFIVPVASNYPSILPGDRILVNKIFYQKQEPQRGEMIVFINPKNRHIKYIKRIIAIAGDTVEIRDNEVYINDIKLERSPIPMHEFNSIKIDIEEKPLTGKGYYETIGNNTYKIFLANPPLDKIPHDFARITVPDNQCFVMGDNRNITEDSRYFGSIPLATIIGKAEYLYCPVKDWSRFGRLE